MGGLAGMGAARPGVAGLAAWILAEFACLLVLWASQIRGSRAGVDGAEARSLTVVSIASAPLVTGVLVALAVSLIVAG